MNSSEIGGPTSAFTRYVKQPEQSTQVINTRTRRKSAFSRIKRLFSIGSDKYEDKTITSKDSNDSRND
jgi:hypothetical protein